MKDTNVEKKLEAQAKADNTIRASLKSKMLAAKKLVSLEDHMRDTAGVECRKDVDVIDETPKAYKNIDDVMRSQEDLVEIVATLKQIVCVKG